MLGNINTVGNNTSLIRTQQTADGTDVSRGLSNHPKTALDDYQNALAKKSPEVASIARQIGRAINPSFELFSGMSEPNLRRYISAVNLKAEQSERMPTATPKDEMVGQGLRELEQELCRYYWHLKGQDYDAMISQRQRELYGARSDVQV